MLSRSSPLIANMIQTKRPGRLRGSRKQHCKQFIEKYVKDRDCSVIKSCRLSNLFQLQNTFWRQIASCWLISSNLLSVRTHSTKPHTTFPSGWLARNGSSVSKKKESQEPQNSTRQELLTSPPIKKNLWKSSPTLHFPPPGFCCWWWWNPPFSTPLILAPRCYAPGQLELSWGMWRRWCRPQVLPRHLKPPKKLPTDWESWSKFPCDLVDFLKKKNRLPPFKITIEPGKHRKVRASTFFF